MNVEMKPEIKEALKKIKFVDRWNCLETLAQILMI